MKTKIILVILLLVAIGAVYYLFFYDSKEEIAYQPTASEQEFMRLEAELKRR